jgi:hypothetical protein
VARVAAAPTHLVIVPVARAGRAFRAHPVDRAVAARARALPGAAWVDRLGPADQLCEVGPVGHPLALVDLEVLEVPVRVRGEGPARWALVWGLAFAAARKPPTAPPPAAPARTEAPPVGTFPVAVVAGPVVVPVDRVDVGVPAVDGGLAAVAKTVRNCRHKHPPPTRPPTPPSPRARSLWSGAPPLRSWLHVSTAVRPTLSGSC